MGEGEIVVVFPEGTRGDGETLGKARPGLGLIVARSGVPVIPGYISGAGRVWPKGARFLRPRKIRIIYGPPLDLADRAGDPPEKSDFQEISDRAMEEIGALKKKLEDQEGGTR